ncbi:hypothetical protein QA633_43710 [Bradyrhizobium barranii]|uniref:hypothetical protein n=1 Tax=Bradyrhizobium barranii TaxID=2992140 RepID=UPI0024B20BA9|nr:hypothetical protein [Bradyrhizobium barranii]WFT99939.1 hypothetical protein QA633_43710 [Bradyrhizobium barranii]
MMFGWGRSKRPGPRPVEEAAGNLFEPLALLSALDQLLPWYLKETDDRRLVYPACNRRLNDAEGNVRAIWEHTRLEACRYVTMVPRRDVELLVSAVRQSEMMDAFLKQAPHEETVIEFEGVPAVDYANAITAGLNWLDHCAFLAGVDPDKFGRTRRDFRRLVVLAQQWWAIDNAGPRAYEMVANHEVPPLMFCLVWQNYTRLAKEVAIAAIYGSSLDRGIEQLRQHFRTTLSSEAGQLQASLSALTDTAIRLKNASDPDDLVRS